MPGLKNEQKALIFLMRKIKQVVVAALVMLLLVMVAAGFFCGYLWHYARTPAAGSLPATEQVVMVHRGTGIRDVSYLLARHQLIRHPSAFKLLAKVKTRHQPIKAGEYRLSSGQTPEKILARLIAGEVVLHRLTVPEGYTLRQIGQLVEQAGLAGAVDFYRVARDPAVADRHGLAAATCEGYLFPETYFFPASVTAETIVDTMIKRFRAVFNESYQARAKELGFTVHEVVTLASIVEKETGAAVERPQIAAVFHNRLKKRMRLESDPTVIYGIKDFDGNLTRRHLETRTPYNTYRIRGLPPGPIANPGAKSLEAVLYPADVPFLFFVAKKDGTHQFSTNLSDHNRAVRKYQLGR